MLVEKIGQDYIQAMKAKDSVRVSTLSFLRAQMKNVMIDLKAAQLSDEQVQDVIRKQVKQRKDSIQQYEKGGRQDLADKEKLEMGILQSYLPPAMSAEELTPYIQEAVQNVNAQGMKDMGKVMKEVLAKVGDRADGTLISELVKKVLSEL